MVAAVWLPFLRVTAQLKVETQGVSRTSYSGITMYVTTWEEFEKAAQNIYLKDPDKARYVMKYCHSKSVLHVKMTDNVDCVQYKTEILQDLKKIDKFINNLMRHMTSKPVSS